MCGCRTVVQEFLQLNHRSSDSDENLTDDSAPSSGDEVFLGSSERCQYVSIIQPYIQRALLPPMDDIYIYIYIYIYRVSQNK